MRRVRLACASAGVCACVWFAMSLAPGTFAQSAVSTFPDPNTCER